MKQRPEKKLRGPLFHPDKLHKCPGATLVSLSFSHIPLISLTRSSGASSDWGCRHGHSDPSRAYLLKWKCCCLPKDHPQQISEKHSSLAHAALLSASGQNQVSASNKRHSSSCLHWAPKPPTDKVTTQGSNSVDRSSQLATKTWGKAAVPFIHLPKSTFYRTSAHLSLCIDGNHWNSAASCSPAGSTHTQTSKVLPIILRPVGQAYQVPDSSSVKCLAVSRIEISTAVIYHDPELIHRSQLCNFR